MVDTMALLFPYEARTGDVVVRVAVSFLPDQSAPSQGRWFWSYHIRIENLGKDSIQLLARYWRIVDGNGNMHEVRGQGVVGEMPVIPAGESYDYVSGCPLDTPSGEMSGRYMMVDQSGSGVEVDIPRFILTGPSAGEP